MEFDNLNKYSNMNHINYNKQRVGLLIKGKNKYIASTYIRLLSAFNKFNDKNFEFYIIDDLELKNFRFDLSNNICKLDIIIVQRDAISLEFSELLIKKCKLFGIKLIFEIDDDLINMDQTQPDFERYEKKITVMRYIAENASVITVTTDSLKYSLSGFNKNIEIIPNVLTDSWKLNKEFIKNNETIKIGYMGTTTHANDLKLIEKAVAKIKEDYPNKNIIFEIVGGSENKLDGFNHINIPPDKRHYPDFVKWVQNTINWDISIAPLVENNYINESKSELKYLEYTALNSVGIYSPVGPYSKCIVHGVNGLLVKNNSCEEWVENMKKLIDNEYIREKIHQNAWKDILKNYTLNNLITNWKIVLNRNKRDKKSILYRMVREYSNKNQDISFNQFLLNESKTIIESSGLFDEEYYLSKYPDVKNSSLSPIDHYLTLGAAENCNPREDFNCEEYIKKNNFVNELEITPFVHYILYNDFNDNYPIVSCNDKKQNIEIIKKSKLFDPEFYLNDNPDVKNAKLDPYVHYVNYGYKEKFRNPFPNFSNLFYKNNYLNNSNTWNPLTHYILIGEQKGYNTNIWGWNNKHYDNIDIHEILTHLNKKISVIIPIYNYSEKVIESIKLLLKNTKQSFELEVIINQETHEQYSQFFNKISDKYQININLININAFTNIIKEIISNSQNDIILLNSYTKVTENWLNRLIIKAYSNSDIDLISPISNFIGNLNPLNEYNENNFNEHNLTIEGISTLIKKSSNLKNIYSDIGDAFCIYIKNKRLNYSKINKFEVTYDFYNKRALLKIPKNVTHVIDNSCYIYHDEQFFSDNSHHYHNTNNNFNSTLNINKFLESPLIKDIKNKFDIAFNDKRTNSLSNRILYILNEKDFNLLADFINYYNQKHYDCYFLTCTNDYFKLWKDNEIIYSWNITQIQFNKHFRCDFLKNIYFNILSMLNINIIQINDFKFNSFDLFEISDILNISIILNYSTLDTEEAFDTNSCLIKNRGAIEDLYHNWQYDLSNFIKKTFIIHPTEESLIKFNKEFNLITQYKIIQEPTISKRLISLIEEHESNPINVLVPGDLSEKEFNMIKYIKKNDSSDLLKIHFLGDIPNYEKQVGFNHGAFSKDNLNLVINKINPHCVILLNAHNKMFNIMNSCKTFKIPIIFDENALKNFIEELNISTFTNFRKSDIAYNYILNFTQWHNYYKIIKKLYCNDIILKKDIIRYDTELNIVYLKFGNNYPKSIIKQKPLSDRDNNKTINFTDFEGFLANSYVSPIIYSPFVEEEKRCFAVMDNIAKYLINNVPNDEKLVSIIMPVHNREKIVEKAITSVLNQTYSNFELIIVDDMSTDGTRNILKSIEDNRIKLIFNKSNMGASAARNVALKECSGEYIFYLDSDNEWDSNYLKAMVGAYIELSNADALYSGQLLYENINKPPFAIRYGSLNKSLLKNGNYIDLNCFSHTKKVYEEIGGFNESLYRLVDWDLILRICNNFKVYSVPVLLSKYYMSITNNSISDENAKSNEKMLSYKNLTMTIQYINETKKIIDYDLDKKVSIIIPSFESLNDLQECIDTILSFKNEKLKIIVVDNNSSPAVRYYLETLKSEGLIELIQNDINYGFTYAVNQGINISNDDSDILLLNNDAILTEGAIEVMQKTAYEQKNCGIVVPQQVLPGGTHTMKTHVPYASAGFECDVTPSSHHKNIVNMNTYHDGELLELSFAPFFCTYIKRDVLNESIGLDAELGRHYRSDRIFSEYIRHIMKLHIFHVSDAVVYHKLQKSTLSLRKNEDDYTTMLLKNRWESDLAKQLGFKQPDWDEEDFV